MIPITACTKNMEIVLDKFLSYNERGRSLPDLYDIAEKAKLEAYYSGVLPEYTDVELKRINEFTKSELLIDLQCEMYHVVTQEIFLNVVHIPNQDQLKRYLSYLTKEINISIDVINDSTRFQWYKDGAIDFNEMEPTDKLNIHRRVHSDPSSLLLDSIDGVLNQYEQILDHIEDIRIENGLQPTDAIASNLIFRGLPADFIELVSALHIYGSIQHKTGQPLKKSDLVKEFRKFLNLDKSPGFDDQNLSRRYSERKTALRSSYLNQLKKAFGGAS